MIRNKEHLRRIFSFSGLEWHNGIRPTDVDFLVEMDDRLLFIGDAKHGDSKLLAGQQLAFQRLCDVWSLSSPERHAYAFTFNHNSNDTIEVAHCTVSQYYIGKGSMCFEGWNGRGIWHEAPQESCLIDCLSFVYREVFSEENRHAPQP